MTDDDALRVLLQALEKIPSSADTGVQWLKRKLLVARGYYAADDDLEYEDAIVDAEVEAAWAAICDDLPEQELLYLYGMGGHPGGSWADIVRRHDLPRGGSVYTREIDIADAGSQWTFLIATAERPEDDTDSRVVETAISLREPPGLEVARSALSGTVNEMRTVLPRPRLVKVLVAAWDKKLRDEFFLDSFIGDLGSFIDDEESPAHPEPETAEWSQWVIETYLEDVYRD
jgi:hypothetical protein